MNTLKGKNALVTGTSQGIGAAISKELIESGCNVCLHYYSSPEKPEELKKLAEANGVKAFCIKADLTVEQEVIACIKEAVNYFGRFDILVNNAGALVERRAVEDIDLSFWQKVIDLNMTSMMLVTREVFSHLNREEGSSIINISSLAGRKGGGKGSLVYSTQKGAVLTWTRHLSNELAPEGIRVNAVAPGFIEGTRFHKVHTPPENAKKAIQGIPLGRAGNPEDVARAVVFLASEYNGFITGITIDINGGVYCV